MSNEQLAVLLMSYKLQMEQTREKISSSLPDEAFIKTPNVLRFMPYQDDEVVSCPVLYPIDDLISRIDQDIDRLTKKEEKA